MNKEQDFDVVDYEDIDNLTIQRKTVNEKPAKKNYVNNKELLACFIIYKKEVEYNKENGLSKPVIPNTIANAILSISKRHSFSKNFINYSNNWKEEMVGDAIEICVRYVHNFNPEKSNNPFGYITQLIGNAFIQRIDREKRQVYFKFKMHDHVVCDEMLNDNTIDEEDREFVTNINDTHNDRMEFISNFEKSRKEKNRKYKEKIADKINDSDKEFRF